MWETLAPGSPPMVPDCSSHRSQLAASPCCLLSFGGKDTTSCCKSVHLPEASQLYIKANNFSF